MVKTKSWQTALLRANFPSSFHADGLMDILAVTFPGIEFECTVVDVENKDWVSDVQKTWLPQRIGNLTVRFPWHSQDLLPEEILNDVNHQHLVLEGGAAFGTGDHPTTRLCCRWLEKGMYIVCYDSCPDVSHLVAKQTLTIHIIHYPYIVTHQN